MLHVYIKELSIVAKGGPSIHSGISYYLLLLLPGTRDVGCIMRYFVLNFEKKNVLIRDSRLIALHLLRKIPISTAIGIAKKTKSMLNSVSHEVSRLHSQNTH